MDVFEKKGVIYEFGKFVLDPKERTLLAGGVPVRLQSKEFDTLLLLVEHNGHVVTKEEMISAIWPDSVVEEGNIAKKISRLRKVFNTDGEEFIETLPKYGYRFTAELRRAIVEPEDEVILERRTMKRVTFAVEDGEPERLALPPARKRFVTFSRVALLVIAIAGLSFLFWYYRDRILGPAPIDPYAPVRLTDNPNDDTIPTWTKDGRIQFARGIANNKYERWIMNADGSGQMPIAMPEGKTLLNSSPDGKRMLFFKGDDPTKIYLSNADGSGETLLPFRPGSWSPDSKMMTYRQRVPPDDGEIFIYWVETGESRNISNNPAFDADASFSPDGNQVVYTSTRDGNAELYVTNVHGSGVRRLTFNTTIDSHAAFSPDGTEILFGSDREKENGDLYIMNSDGSGTIKLTDWDKSNETAAPGGWSPDGTRIVFYSDRNGKDDIYIVSAETVRPNVVVSDAEHNVGAPSYSPDGTKIAYSAEKEDKSGELRIMDVATGRSRLVRQTELPMVASDWSPDGNRLAFTDRMNGNSEVFVTKPDDDGELQNLTNDPSADGGPTWSPDGKRILFGSGRGEPPGGVQLYVMNADGTDPRPITPRKGFEGDSVWSPDGTSIVFACDRTDSPGNLMDICRINTDGTGEKRLLFHRDHDGQPAVSPDGTRIVFISRSAGNLELYLMNRDGSGLRRLTRHPADDLYPEWHPDGKRIIFTSNRGGKFAIYEVEVPG